MCRANRAELRSQIRQARTATSRATGGIPSAVALLERLAEAGALDADGRRGCIGPVTIAAYLAMPGEPDLAKVIEAVRLAGGLVLVPVPLPDRVLGWARETGEHVSHSKYPVRIPRGDLLGTGTAPLTSFGVTLLLVPALAVDRAGTRLGQGGGYYDVLLSQLSEPAPRVVAVVRNEELLNPGVLPRAPHDWPIREVLTPAGLVTLAEHSNSADHSGGTGG